MVWLVRAGGGMTSRLVIVVGTVFMTLWTSYFWGGQTIPTTPRTTTTTWLQRIHPNNTIMTETTTTTTTASNNDNNDKKIIPTDNNLLLWKTSSNTGTSSRSSLHSAFTTRYVDDDDDTPSTYHGDTDNNDDDETDDTYTHGNDTPPKKEKKKENKNLPTTSTGEKELVTLLKQQQQQQQQSLPPLSSLLIPVPATSPNTRGGHSKNNEKTTTMMVIREGAETKQLLDFAIIGHAKTATSCITKYLSKHAEIVMKQGEDHSLTKGDPALLIHNLYQLTDEKRIQHRLQFEQQLAKQGKVEQKRLRQERQSIRSSKSSMKTMTMVSGSNSNASSWNRAVPSLPSVWKRGYKAPADITKPEALMAIHKYFPETKLVIGLRHPIAWFESYYNYHTRRATTLPNKKSLPDATTYNIQTVPMSAWMHRNLARLGKTALATKEELQLLQLLQTDNNNDDDDDDDDNDNVEIPDDFIRVGGNGKKGRKQIMKLINPVFLYDVSQPFDSNVTRREAFRTDLAAYLGLSIPLEAPKQRNDNDETQPVSSSKNYHYAIDICNATFDSLRADLLRIGQAASEWIPNYFLTLQDVSVSSRDHFVSNILPSWRVDPCIEKKKKRQPDEEKEKEEDNQDGEEKKEEEVAVAEKPKRNHLNGKDDDDDDDNDHQFNDDDEKDDDKSDDYKDDDDDDDAYNEDDDDDEEYKKGKKQKRKKDDDDDADDDHTDSNDDRPPISSLIRGDNETGTIIGDVKFLLDFAIIGHPKTATSTIMRWLWRHNQVQMYNQEIRSLRDDKPVEMVHKLYALKSGAQYKRGYKAPNDIRYLEPLQALGKYWPNAGLIVGLRHPIKWFQSWYNYKVRLGFEVPAPEELTGNAFRDQARYHAHLSLLGKTSMSDPDERELLGLTTTKRRSPKLPPPLPNKVFLYDVSQPFDKNATRKDQFRLDLSSFVGLDDDQPLKPIKEQTSTKNNGMDICDRQYKTLRRELAITGRLAAQWITTYFLDHPDVFVSSRSHFETILATWQTDPCDGDNEKK